MGKLKYLVIHCADTPPTMNVTAEMLDDWHRAPCINEDGTITYLGKKYKGLEYANVLPKHKGKWGRGWDRLGYSDLIHRDGSITNLTPYDDDQEVEAHEMTWGATGVNAISRHICLEGGKSDYGLKGYTSGQFVALQRYVKGFLYLHPTALIAGHSHFAQKLCPNFDVEDFCQLIDIPVENILYKPKK